MDLLSFLYNNLTLNLIIGLGYLVVVAVVWLFPSLVRANFLRLHALRLALTKLFFCDPNRLPRLSRKLAILVLCFNCFFFFNQNFLTATINTESALVKTDEIILSGAQMLRTKKRLGINFYDERMLSSAPNNSLLRKLWEKSHFVIGSNSNESIYQRIIEQGVQLFFFLTREIGLLRLIFGLARFANDDGLVAFSEPKKYHESLTVFYFRRTLDEKRKHFIRRR